MIIRYLKNILFLVTFILLSFQQSTSNDSIEYSVVVIGSIDDSVNISNSHIINSCNHLVFLGDNKVDLVNHNIKLGNKEFISLASDNSIGIQESDILISGGKIHDRIDYDCYEPAVQQINKDLVFIYFNTQWWLKGTKKVNANCEEVTKESYLEKFRYLMEKHRNDQVVVFTHHPIYSTGISGGRFPFRFHLFPLTELDPNLYVPLPLIGSLYPLIRQSIGTKNDIDNVSNELMRKEILSCIVENDDVIFVSGHDNSMQYSRVDGFHQVIPGSLIESEYVRKEDETVYAASKKGYSKLDFYKNSAVSFSFYDVDDSLLFEQNIVEPKFDSKSIDLSVYELESDTADVAANKEFEISSFGEFWLGEGYRKAWTTEVKVPTLNLSTYNGGLIPLKQGGGMVSNSLRLEDKNGKQYALRSIKKDLSNILPDNMIKLEASAIVKDQSSANFPYGGLPIRELSDVLGVYHTNPQLFYVPSQLRLGPFNDVFSNDLYWLEERPNDDGSNSPNFGNYGDIMGYYDVIKKLRKDSKKKVDYKEVLKARIFDLLIHDWDRHDDQWRWAYDDKENTFHPIPRDRDQAFHNMGGFFPSIAYLFVEPKFLPFSDDLSDVVGHSYNARHFDRYFLNSLEKSDWIEMAEHIKSVLSNGKIDSAMKALPSEIYEIHGLEFAQILNERLKHLDEYALELYGYITEKVDIIGSDEKDKFEIEYLKEGSIKVSRYYNTKEKNNLLYLQRVFLEEETNEIRIFGLGDKDIINVTGNNNSSINVKIIGGSGYDKLNGKSKANIEIYDDINGISVSENLNNVSSHLNNDIGNNRYDRYQFEYNTTLPDGTIGYTLDDGLWLGAGFSYTTHGFRKEPFDTRHDFLFESGTTRRKTFSLYYNYIKTDFFGSDFHLGLNFDSKLPFYFNYFGLGNESSISQFESINYNSVRMGKYSVSSMIEYSNPNNRSKIQLVPTLTGYELIHIENRIADDSSAIFDSHLFDLKSFYGASLNYNFNTVENDYMPSKGMKLTLSPFIHKSFSTNNYIYGTNSELISYFTLGRIFQMTFASRLGYNIVSGSPEIYQLNMLGGNNYLRGYRNDRFIGESMAYFNQEVRLPLFNWDNKYLPIDFGFAAGYDIGRVWKDGNQSDELHFGYGVSVTMNILDYLLLIPTYSMSVEESLFTLNAGWRF